MTDTNDSLPTASNPDLDEIWRAKFEEDRRRDQGVEDALLVKAWVTVAFVCLLLLVRRLIV